MDAANYHEIVRGSRRGFAAHVTRGVLSLAQFPYGGAVWTRNYYYDHVRWAVHHVPAPVISVGNLTLGGTGKTPFVAWLAKWIIARGFRVAIVSRGYKAVADRANDEALELREQLADVPHVQNANRAAAARIAMDQFGAQVILLDDGFQHRRLYRDLDIVLLDATQPFGWPSKLFPRGSLREPLSALKRAAALVLTRAPQISPGRQEQIERTARSFAPHASWSTGTHKPVALKCRDGSCQRLDTLVGRRVFAFCGIGNPAAFFQTLRDCGCDLVGVHEFPDHHAFAVRDFQLLAEVVGSVPNVEAVVCTSKDLVKISPQRIAGHPVHALRIEMQLEQGLADLERQLAAVLDAAHAGTARAVPQHR